MKHFTRLECITLWIARVISHVQSPYRTLQPLWTWIGYPKGNYHLAFQMPALTGLHNVPALTGLHNQIAGPALLGHLRLQSIKFRGKPLNRNTFFFKKNIFHFKNLPTFQIIWTLSSLKSFLVSIIETSAIFLWGQVHGKETSFDQVKDISR